MSEIREIKEKLEKVEKMLEFLCQHFQKPETPPPAKVYQLKEKARKKALEIKKKFEVEL
ncbi:hypothetical protein QI155_03345 [Thermodesulfovibrio sp. 1176]|uniref:hypothetical protein n=1 Tax=Thermodesulfovibrio sp. 1176 TaxID=3043424 RepID=UPI0024826F92|nr:hypothetical protein [Thermodesulfovibrio sp. 1176]MDI1471559.1 hypothetical protein [Thermodesulfovibrio sp. 1176]